METQGLCEKLTGIMETWSNFSTEKEYEIHGVSSIYIFEFVFLCVVATFVLYFYLGFLSQTFTIHRAAGKGEAITPLYHLKPLHRPLDIS